ncbi:MAG: helical backbone metal receptor [Chitinophagales bacterium]|nr:helical backbone metal receptor [Chitinophagales bacterium]
MPDYTDQTGYRFYIANEPARIISLVPSQTELLHYLGLGHKVVGITRFCIHPKEWRQEKTIIGGTKNFKFEIIDALKPDLIIGNKEENYKEGIELLRRKYPVWLSDVNDLPSAFRMIEDVGLMCGTTKETFKLLNDISLERKKFHETKRLLKPKIAYFIWKRPYMVAASETFINSMIEEAGFENIFKNFKRYPEFEPEDLRQYKPDIVFLSSEPYQFRTKHIEEFRSIFPQAKISIVDGEMFSWYGPRIKDAYIYFSELWNKLLGD